MTKQLVALAGHGDIAPGMRSAATLILGERDDLRALPSYSGDVNAIRHHVDALLDELGDADTLILVSDLLGGSVSNTLLEYQHDNRVHQITGMTLSLVLELLTTQPVSADGAIDAALMDRARAAVTVLPLPHSDQEDDF
ncbi:PTS sugar transporter subunit IIA [Pseudoclavibacter helvolus]|uniref:PTS sugar transporter subunit IIA n=1 Tax=Pseudoclavibacter helvolus TaxID=255205 RepID=UPI003C708474